MVRPHRKDGYRYRRRVHVRVDEVTVGTLDELASALSLSRAHLCDLILGIAVDEGGTWLNACIARRVKAALDRRRESRS
jgi:hypothetical protein